MTQKIISPCNKSVKCFSEAFKLSAEFEGSTHETIETWDIPSSFKLLSSITGHREYCIHAIPKEHLEEYKRKLYTTFYKFEGDPLTYVTESLGFLKLKGIIESRRWRT